MDLQLSRHEIFATGSAFRISIAKPTVCTAGCELVLHNENFLGVTTSVSWRPATAKFRRQTGFADTAPRCILTKPTFGTRATTSCGGLGRSARVRLVGDIWCDFWMIQDRSSFLVLRRASSTQLRRELYEVLGKVHLASVFERGVQCNVGESRGAAVDS